MRIILVKTTFVLFIILVNSHLLAQNNGRVRFSADLGVIKTTGLNDSLTNTLSYFSGFAIESPFFIKKGLYFTTGLGLYDHQFLLDAYFSKQGDKTILKTVENGIINNKVEILTLKLPLLFTFPLFSNDGKAIALSAGADLDLFVNGTRKYKQLRGSNITEKFTIDNKLQIPLRIEVSTLNLSKQHSINNLFYGFGVRQQVTNYIKGNSFKPFDAYFRVGIQF
jgi:hypothetical protein